MLNFSDVQMLKKFWQIFLFQIMIQTRTIQSSLTLFRNQSTDAPLKMKIQRRNHATFISGEMRKAIQTRSRLRNKFCKNPSEENERKYNENRIYVYRIIREQNNKQNLRVSLKQTLLLNNKFSRFLNCINGTKSRKNITSEFAIKT